MDPRKLPLATMDMEEGEEALLEEEEGVGWSRSDIARKGAFRSVTPAVLRGLKFRDKRCPRDFAKAFRLRLKSYNDIRPPFLLYVEVSVTNSK